MKKFFSLERILALLPFFILFFLFLWPLITLQKSFIGAEYRVQHLPWAQYYSELLHRGQFPFWTSLITGGFPLAAEGQVAPFYLLNWVSYKILPFIAAYTWSIPLHMLIGGLGMYAYGRKLGMSRPAASLSSLSYTFGSAYAGCFYYTGTLKVLAWMPLCLIVLEEMRMCAKRRRVFLMSVLAVLAAFAWTAGFPQVAVYFFFYAFLHECLAVWGGSVKEKINTIFFLIAAIALGTLLALPQVALTTQLAGESLRKGESLSFALWGSVPPPAFISLIFPEWGNALRISFYLGILPLFFAIFAVFFSKKENRVWRHILLGSFFLLLSLGRFNPVYKWAIETFSLTAIRNPSKFLFFSAASFSLLAGFGLDRFLSASSGDERRKAYGKFVAKFTGFVILLPLIGRGLVMVCAPLWENYSRWYVSNLIAGKGGHAKSFEEYLGMMDNFFKSLKPLFSYQNSANLETFALTSLSFLLIRFFLLLKIKKNIFLTIIFTLLCWDLYFFSICPTI